jgi:hypothetical protein
VWELEQLAEKHRNEQSESSLSSGVDEHGHSADAQGAGAGSGSLRAPNETRWFSEVTTLQSLLSHQKSILGMLSTPGNEKLSTGTCVLVQHSL